MSSKKFSDELKYFTTTSFVCLRFFEEYHEYMYFKLSLQMNLIRSELTLAMIAFSTLRNTNVLNIFQETVAQCYLNSGAHSEMKK